MKSLLSGSPIIQDGRLIGAVTHVMVSDPTTGYGIFIGTGCSSITPAGGKASPWEKLSKGLFGTLLTEEGTAPTMYNLLKNRTWAPSFVSLAAATFSQGEGFGRFF